MKPNQILMIVVVWALQGCLGMSANTEAAKEPFPGMPQNPDGRCPDLTGVYPVAVYPEELTGVKSWSEEIWIPAAFFGMSLNPALDIQKLEERKKAIKNRNSKTEPSTLISFNYLDQEKLEISYWMDEVKVNSTQTNPKKMYPETDPAAQNKSGSSIKIGSIICDRGTAYQTISSYSRGTEGGSKRESLNTLTKSPNGELIYTLYKLSRLYAFGTIPMGGSRTIHTYRYPPYTGQGNRTYPS